MSHKKTTNSMVAIVKSIFVCMGVLFFFYLFGKENIYAETGNNSITTSEWKFETYQFEGVEYADLTEYMEKENTQIMIPKYVQDEMGNPYPVGRISSIAKEQAAYGINKIYISQEIEQITLGKGCFAFCESLKEVEIACKVQVEEGTFCGCKNLEKIWCQKGISAYGVSMDTFAGCGKLADIIVSSGKIQVTGGVFDSIPREVCLTLEDTVELQVKEDITRGNVNLVCYKNVSAKEDTEIVVKNGYFYYSQALAEHLIILSQERLYGITSSPVFRENEENFIDIVAGIEIGEVRNTAFYVAKDKGKKITAKDLKIVTDGKEDTIKVICYAPKGRKSLYIQQWQDSEKENDYSKGAILLCEILKAGEAKCPVIVYSGKRYILGEIQGHNSLPTSVEIQLADDACMIEGMKAETVSEKLLVTVLFENGTYKELLSKEDFQLYINDEGYLVWGQENNLFVTVQKDYEITGQLSKVAAVKKQVISGSAIYTGSTKNGVGTALEGTKPDLEDFSIIVMYDNGEKEYLQNPSITLLFDEVRLGEQEYNILCEGCKMTVKITGVQDCIQNIKVMYMDEWLPVGESLDTGKIQFILMRESGKQIEVQSYKIEEYQIQEGENSIRLFYSGNLPFVPTCEKTAELVVFGAKKEEITTEIYLKKEDLNFMSGSVIDTSLFEVKQTYQGKSLILENPDISLFPYELKTGENILQIQYQEKVYLVSIWVRDTVLSNTEKPEIEPTRESVVTVPDSISVTPVPKPQFIGEISIAGTGKIKFHDNGKDSYQIYEKKPVTLAFSMKKIKKVQWQLVLKGKKYKKSAWKNLNGSVWSYHKNVINGVLYIQITDENGTVNIKKTNGFTIDHKKPTLNIADKKNYSKGACIKAVDKESGIKKITLNGKKISNGKKVTKKGKYQLLVWDKAGNCTKRIFFVS